MSMENLTPPAASVWPPPPTNTQADGRSRLRALLARYRSPTPLSRWVLGFLAITVVADVAETIGVMMGAQGAALSNAGSITSALTLLMTGVLFLTWVHRLYKNLTALGVSGLKHSAAISVVMFFVPFLNIYKPIVVMNEIWRATSPQEDLDRVGGRWTQTKIYPLIIFWWVAYYAYNLMSAFSSMDAEKGRVDASAYEAASTACVISGVLLTILTLRLSKRQEQRHLDVAASLED